MLSLCGVVVFHRSMVNWRGYICHRYMCILLYVKLIWSSDIPQIYGKLKEGGLYVKLMWCSGIPQIYGLFEEGVGIYLVYWYSTDLWSIGGGGLGICAFCYM